MYNRNFIFSSMLLLFSILSIQYSFSQTPGPLGVSKFTVDDNEDAWASDNSEGDDDGIVEQGERIRLDIFLLNGGTATATGVQATISTESPAITITKPTISYEDIPAGEELSSAGIWRDGFHFVVDPAAASEDVKFSVQINSANAGSYSDSVIVALKGDGTVGPIDISQVTLDDDEETWADDNSNGDGDGKPENGETVRMVVSLLNSGTAPAFDVEATLSTDNEEIVISNPVADYAVLADGVAESNAGIWRDGFHFNVNLAAEEETEVLFFLDISTRNSGTYLDTIAVSIAPAGIPGPIVIESFLLDDDDDSWADDHSKGDEDGIAEQGETIRMPITLKNSGTASVYDIQATLSTTSEYVTITNSEAEYGVLGEGESKDNAGIWRDGFHFKVNSDAESADVLFKLDITSANAGSFIDSFVVSIVGGGVVGPIQLIDFKIDDDNDQWADDNSSGNGDGIIDENETIRLEVTLKNDGTATAIDLSATLSTDEPLITITEPTKSFGTVGAGEEADNAGIWRDGFHFTVASSIPQKDVPFRLVISTSDGHSFTDSLTLSIGKETDQSPPIISLITPKSDVAVPLRRFPIELFFDDGQYGSGIDTASFRFTTNRDIGVEGAVYSAGTNLAGLFTISDSGAVLTVSDDLEFPEGESVLNASVSDLFGNTGTAEFTIETSLFGLLNAADSSYVNTTPFTLQGFAVQKYVEAVEVNGTAVAITNDLFDYNVDLNPGYNSVTVTAFDASGTEIGSEQFTLIYDNAAPVVTITSPQHGSTVDYSPITISGTASDLAPFEVLLNGVSIAVEDGQFEVEREIDEGENEFNIEAVDNGGNRTTVSVTVIGKPADSPEDKHLLYLKDNVLSKFKFQPYPPNTTMGFRISYVFGETIWKYPLNEDIPGDSYEFSLLAGCYGLGSAIMEAELAILHNGTETVIATTPAFTGSMAGPTPFGYSGPSRKSFTVSGVDPETAAGDTLLLRIRKTGGDRVGLIFTQELSRGHSWITVPRIPTTVADTQNEIPIKYQLRQNYPNPFNPETYIPYDLPERTYVKLAIYNLMGQRVKTLVDKFQPAGSHTVHWDATDDNGSNVASGVYLYRWVTPKMIRVRKLTLLR